MVIVVVKVEEFSKPKGRLFLLDKVVEWSISRPSVISMFVQIATRQIDLYLLNTIDRNL